MYFQVIIWTQKRRLDTKDTHTLRNQACKIRRERADEITKELHRNFVEIAPRVLNIQSDPTKMPKVESVRLGATRDLLDRAVFRPVARHEIVKEKSVEELNAQLVSLVGKNGAEMLISAFRSRRSISGLELAPGRLLIICIGFKLYMKNKKYLETL